ncbi:MAG: FkbM family methyltransferase, partial [Anaerolineales bacterium]|nr:FkbM family methyltransferase [Anaerolineales bacterium]
MREPNLLTKDLRVLLSWEPDPYQVPPIQLSERQLTLCTHYDSVSLQFVSQVQIHGETPAAEPYDLYQLVREEMGYQGDFDLVVVNISGIKLNLPYNISKFGCPTVAIVADTHHGFHSPIGELLEYLILEPYDYLVFPYCRQHMHWFYACGFDNVGWLPLLTMTTYTHEFLENRDSKVVFICGDTSFHPYRHRVIDALRNSSLPLQIGTFDRTKSAEIYAHALISLNCSSNGDISLRNLEIVASGGFLLTDQLSPQSGFNYLLTPGQECDVYTSRKQLLEKISHYLEYPEQAINMARKTYDKFFDQLHPSHRINELYRWVFEGDESSRFLKNYDSRMAISRQYADLLESRITIYEQIQELHKLQENISVIIGDNCPLVFAIDLVDLPRARIYVQGRDEAKQRVIDELGLSSQIRWVEDADIRKGEKFVWDIYVYKNQPMSVNFRFAICLDDNNQIAHSSLSGLNKIRLLKVQSKDGQKYLITFIDDSSCQYIVDEIMHQSCYPILDFIGPVSAIVDIGANIGIAATHFRANYPQAKIYCFEPDPFAFVLLQENARKLKDCYVFPLGLYSRDVTMQFYLGESSVHSSIYSNSLSSHSITIDLKQANKFLRENGITSIDILKVNTEGCEVDILRNMEPQNFGTKVIYLEFHSESDRRIIDQILTPYYILWQGSIMTAH